MSFHKRSLIKQIPKEETKISNYLFKSTIGNGTFGKVKLAIHLPSSEPVAIKILEKDKLNSESDSQRVTCVINILKSLSHPNILNLYELIETKKTYYIVTEYIKGEDLLTYILNQESLKENEASYILAQLLNGIENMQLQKIAHRDLKAENIIIKDDKKIKIIDLGFANFYNNKDELLSTPCGSPCYTPPEIIKGGMYKGSMVDIWALGVILYSMIYGYLPFDDINNDRIKIIRKIIDGKFILPDIGNRGDKVSEEAKDLIMKLLNGDPEKRIKIDDIKRHPFLLYGIRKYENDFIKENKVNSNERTFRDEIIKYMVEELGGSEKNESGLYTYKAINDAINNNEYNNLTTTYKLFLKQYMEGRFNKTIYNDKYTDNIITADSLIPDNNQFLNYKNSIITRKQYENNKKAITIDGNNTKSLSSYSNSNNTMIDDLNNVINNNQLIDNGKLNSITNSNNIIIINNTNMITQPIKMNSIYKNIVKSNINNNIKINNCNTNNNLVKRINNQAISKKYHGKSLKKIGKVKRIDISVSVDKSKNNSKFKNPLMPFEIDKKLINNTYINNKTKKKIENKIKEIQTNNYTISNKSNSIKKDRIINCKKMCNTRLLKNNNYQRDFSFNPKKRKKNLKNIANNITLRTEKTSKSKNKDSYYLSPTDNNHKRLVTENNCDRSNNNMYIVKDPETSVTINDKGNKTINSILFDKANKTSNLMSSNSITNNHIYYNTHKRIKKIDIVMNKNINSNTNTNIIEYKKKLLNYSSINKNKVIDNNNNLSKIKNNIGNSLSNNMTHQKNKNNDLLTNNNKRKYESLTFRNKQNLISHNFNIKIKNSKNKTIKNIEYKPCFTESSVNKNKISKEIQKKIKFCNSLHNNINESKVLVINNIDKDIKEFAACSSCLDRDEIINKLNEFCLNNKLIINRNINKNYYCICINKLNKFTLQIEELKGLSLIKMFHFSGDKNITKSIMKKIIDFGF